MQPRVVPPPGPPPGPPFGPPPGPPLGPPPGPGRAAAGSAGTPVLLTIAAVVVGLWIVGSTFLLQSLTWLVADVLGVAAGQEVPPLVWVVVAGVHALIVAGPAALVALLSRRFGSRLPGVRAAGLAWLSAGLCAGLLGSVRAVPVAHNEVLLLITAVMAGALALALRQLRLRRAARGGSTEGGSTEGGAAQGGATEGGTAPTREAVGFGLAAGLLVLLPWLWAGALGGLTETLLAVAAAVAVGWLAASILDGAFFAAYGRSRPWQVLVGGLAAGTTLIVLGAAVGGRGVSLAEMFTLPALGFVLAALAASVAPARLGRLGVAGAVGAVALGPLAFVDPEETSLVLGFSDVGMWTIVATGLAILTALVVGTLYAVLLRPGRGWPRWVPVGTAAIVALAGAGVYAGAGQPGLHGDRLLVVMEEQADLSGLDAIGDRNARLRATYERLVTHAETTQAPLRRALDRFGLEYTPYYLVNAVLVNGGPVVRQWLSGRSDVDRVLLDQRLRPLPSPAPVARGSSPAPDGPQWNIQLIGADRVWSKGARGQGIVIGTSDSGVDGEHPALREGFRGGDDSWYDPWNGTATPTDHGGHGTHTLGSALGRGGIGVAPEAQWVGCVNLDRNLGSPSLYLDCLQFMLAPFPRGGDPWRDGRPERAPHVLTNSWGCPRVEGCDMTSLQPATAALRAAGIFFVAAAGNTGPRCSSIDDPPAPYADVFTVAAIDRERMLASFSSRGPADDGRRQARPRRTRGGGAVGPTRRHVRRVRRHLDGHPARRRGRRAHVVGQSSADRRPGTHRADPARNRRPPDRHRRRVRVVSAEGSPI